MLIKGFFIGNIRESIRFTIKSNSKNDILNKLRVSEWTEGKVYIKRGGGVGGYNESDNWKACLKASEVRKR